MRALWTGSLSFGLVNIPVRLYSASEEKALSFHMLDKKDLSPIRFARICREEEKEVPYADIVKGYEYKKGDYVVLSDEDFRKANVRRTNTIDIIEFSEGSDVDPNYYEKPYYLGPDKGAENPYALLRAALQETKKVGIAKFVLHNREHLAVVRPGEEVIVLNQLRFAEELRPPKGLKVPSTKAVSKKELDMATMLIDQLTETFNPKKYKDTYAAEIESVIEAKAKGHVVKAKGKELKPSKVSDLMSLLQRSLDKKAKRAA